MPLPSFPWSAFAARLVAGVHRVHAPNRPLQGSAPPPQGFRVIQLAEFCQPVEFLARYAVQRKGRTQRFGTLPHEVSGRIVGVGALCSCKAVSHSVSGRRAYSYASEGLVKVD